MPQFENELYTAPPVPPKPEKQSIASHLWYETLYSEASPIDFIQRENFTIVIISTQYAVSMRP